MTYVTALVHWQWQIVNGHAADSSPCHPNCACYMAIISVVGIRCGTLVISQLPTAPDEVYSTGLHCWYISIKLYLCCMMVHQGTVHGGFY